MPFQPRGLRRVWDDRRDGAVDLARRPLVAVRIEHARERSHDLTERPERGSLAVRQGTTLQPAPIAMAVERAGELRHQPRLADPRDPDEGEELRLEFALDPIERPSEQRELPLATHERCVARSPAGHRRAGSNRVPYADRVTLAFGHDGRRVVELDRPLGRPASRLVDEDAAGRCGRLQAGGGVDAVAGGGVLALLDPCVERDQRLTGGDAGVDLQVSGGGKLLTDRQRGPYGALGVILVRHGRAEDRHDRVANELRDRATVPLEDRAQVGVVRLQEPLHILGIHSLGARREPHEVGEQHRDDLALLAEGTCFPIERGATCVAEPRAGGVLLPANLARGHRESLQRHQLPDAVM
jgi:hypothetical protein